MANTRFIVRHFRLRWPGRASFLPSCRAPHRLSVRRPPPSSRAPTSSWTRRARSALSKEATTRLSMPPSPASGKSRMSCPPRNLTARYRRSTLHQGCIRFRVGEDAIAVIKKDLGYAAMSDGAFDPSVGPLVKLWGIGTNHARLPVQSRNTGRLESGELEGCRSRREGADNFPQAPGHGSRSGLGHQGLRHRRAGEAALRAWCLKRHHRPRREHLRDRIAP